MIVVTPPQNNNNIYNIKKIHIYIYILHDGVYAEVAQHLIRALSRPYTPMECMLMSSIPVMHTHDRPRRLGTTPRGT